VTFTVNVLNGLDKSMVSLTGKGGTVGSNSGLGTDSITAVPGINPANTLNVPMSAGWVLKTKLGINYYNADAAYLIGAATYPRTFSFTVPTGTAPDKYEMAMKATGVDTTFGMWTESTPINLTVVPEPATLVMLLGGSLVGLVCWRGRKRIAAK
jgi:hypothetical protein